MVNVNASVDLGTYRALKQEALKANLPLEEFVGLLVQSQVKPLSAEDVFQQDEDNRKKDLGLPKQKKKGDKE